MVLPATCDLRASKTLAHPSKKLLILMHTPTKLLEKKVMSVQKPSMEMG